MKGDFSRDTFNLRKNFSRVLMQQGRVQLDADFNEQSSILLHYIRMLVTDLIGPHAGVGDSFAIDFLKDKDKIVPDVDGNPKDLTIAPGHYYVDGILCVNDGNSDGKPFTYFKQPNYRPEGEKLPEIPYLVYLDVWERHITCFEDESLCEVALDGVDTTTRAQIVWQVKVLNLEHSEIGKGCAGAPLPTPSNAQLLAQTRQPETLEDPCNIKPDARYRGAENQLYRVEIHRGSIDETRNKLPTVPTFKWSRENASVVFTVKSITISDDTTEVSLAGLGRDDKFSLNEGDWVELIDDSYTLHNRAGRLMQIASIDRDEMSVSLTGTPTFPISENPANHPLLRRWDQKAGVRQEGGLTLNAGGEDPDNAAEIIENVWLNLEDGIEIKFQKDSSGETIYRTGEYWLIPARTVIGDVLWGKDSDDNSLPQPPNGVKHHYAPLGLVTGKEIPKNCRCTIDPITDCEREKKETKTRVDEATRTTDNKMNVEVKKAGKTKSSKSPT